MRVVLWNGTKKNVNFARMNFQRKLRHKYCRMNLNEANKHAEFHMFLLPEVFSNPHLKQLNLHQMRKHLLALLHAFKLL